MASTLRSVILVSNASHYCENATRSNVLDMNQLFGVKVYKLVMICLPILNCFLNGVCCIVFRALKPANTFNRILMYLSICEVLFQLAAAYCQLIIYLMETNQLAMGSLHLTIATAGTITASFVVLTAFHLMRNWMVVLISYYRYCSASVPSLTSCIFSGSRKRLKSCAFVAACFAIAVPRCLEFSVLVCSSAPQVTKVRENLSHDPVYRMLYFGVILFLVQNVGPLLLLLYFSACLCLIMHRQRVTRMALQSRGYASNHQQHGSQLVIVLCAVFLLCETPTLLKVFHMDGSRVNPIAYASNLLTCIDSTLNIIVYNLSNREFRGALWRWLPSFRRIRGRATSSA